MLTVPKRKRIRNYYETTSPVLVQQPKYLVLRYEDASTVKTAYVNWVYNFAEPLQGYTSCRLMSVKLYNNYATNRLSHIGVNVTEFPKQVRGGAQTNNNGPTFCVPNSNYATAGFTLASFDTTTTYEPVYIDNLSISNLTITLTDGVGSNLTASGVPAGFFCDIIFLLN